MVRTPEHAQLTGQATFTITKSSPSATGGTENNLLDWSKRKIGDRGG